MSASSSSGEAPFNVAFTNNSSNADELRWDFGDGATNVTDPSSKQVTHEYTKAGTYTVSLEAVKNGEPPQTSKASVTVEVVAGALAKVALEKQEATLQPGGALSIVAQALDQYDNPIPGLSLSYRADEKAGKVDGAKFAAGTKADVYKDAVTVEAVQGGVTKVASLTITVVPGALAKVALEKQEATLQPGGVLSIVAQALDQYDNPIPGLSLSYRADEKVGKVDGAKFTAGTKAGVYKDAVTVEAAQGGVTKAASLTIAVVPGPVHHVTVTPQALSLKIGATKKLAAAAFDTYDNPIPDARISWAALGLVGSVSDSGVLIVGTKAGAYQQAVKATATIGTASAEAYIAVTVVPDPLSTVSVLPVEVVAGADRQLAAAAADQYGNAIQDVQLSWSTLDPDAGSVTSSGLLTAGKVAGKFINAVKVRASQGSVTRESTTPVTIVPGPLELVAVAPSTVAVGMEMTQQFVAAGADKYGNRLAGLSFSWAVDKGAGVIDARGLYTAPKAPGTTTVKVTVTHGSSTGTGTATVTVESDRILFSSNRGKPSASQDQFDLYLMNADGSNQQRILPDASEMIPAVASWSPDGRRLVVNSCATFTCGIIVMSDDGEWVAVLSAEGDFYPSWSPGGDKIAFASLRDGDSEIFVMDVDGGNAIQLTANAARDSSPVWSPDGKKIAFVSDRDGNNEIYVMNADGSEQKRLTLNAASGSAGSDALPVWSPDGKEIIFQSGRSGTAWGIYTMNPDGTNVRQLVPPQQDWNYQVPALSWDGTNLLFQGRKTGESADIYVMDLATGSMTRLTTDVGEDLVPAWAPRKAGVAVSDASVVIPMSGALKAMTVQEVTAKVRTSVVRIVTDLGSGSGVILTSNGVILTNNHVIVDAKTIAVYLDDGTKLTGVVKWRDQVRDLALVKVEATGLPAASLGDLGQVAVGADAVVLGYPLGGKDLTVTKGIVSSVKSDVGRNVTWLQTDSAVNPGNSGGPVFNLQGQVVGIVSAKIVSPSVENVGFAIAVNTLRLYLPDLTKL
ncbi:MAG: trypsin-like peptidase domain-containing protein [Chloroflexota bacterium]|nr:trypsin-like peptidase domain-containing protein [Chloroflexota bacterium]